MPFRTLGDLRGELLARLGMGGMGPSGGANQALIDSFLRNGQEQLYWLQDWRFLTEFEDKTLGVGQNLIDYPNSCERSQRVLRVEYPYNEMWTRLDEGITTEMWSTMETLSYPSRYERYAQIQMYPKADQLYTIRIWYMKDLARFTESGDNATLDDSMVFLHALANAKAHYRQPDAQTYQGQLDTLLSRIRGQSFGSNGVIRRQLSGGVQRKPLVVGRDVP